MTLSQDDNLFSGGDIPTAPPSIEPPQLCPQLAYLSIGDPPPPAPSSPSPEHAPDVPHMNDPTGASPTTTTAVTNLLSSFGNHSNPPTAAMQPNSTTTVVRPKKFSWKSYPSKKRSQNAFEFPSFHLLTSRLGSKVYKFIKDPPKRMKTYSRITKNIERLVCMTLSLLSCYILEICL